jgi:hypothetical protein
MLRRLPLDVAAPEAFDSVEPDDYSRRRDAVDDECF